MSPSTAYTRPALDVRTHTTDDIHIRIDRVTNTDSFGSFQLHHSVKKHGFIFTVVKEMSGDKNTRLKTCFFTYLLCTQIKTLSKLSFCFVPVTLHRKSSEIRIICTSTYLPSIYLHIMNVSTYCVPLPTLFPL